MPAAPKGGRGRGGARSEAKLSNPSHPPTMAVLPSWEIATAQPCWEPPSRWGTGRTTVHVGDRRSRPLSLRHHCLSPRSLRPINSLSRRLSLGVSRSGCPAPLISPAAFCCVDGDFMALLCRQFFRSSPSTLRATEFFRAATRLRLSFLRTSICGRDVPDQLRKLDRVSRPLLPSNCHARSIARDDRDAALRQGDPRSNRSTTARRCIAADLPPTRTGTCPSQPNPRAWRSHQAAAWLRPLLPGDPLWGSRGRRRVEPPGHQPVTKAEEPDAFWCPRTTMLSGNETGRGLGQCDLPAFWSHVQLPVRVA
jgi:hypothetical protein